MPNLVVQLQMLHAWECPPRSGINFVPSLPNLIALPRICHGFSLQGWEVSTHLQGIFVLVCLEAEGYMKTPCTLTSHTPHVHLHFDLLTERGLH